MRKIKNNLEIGSRIDKLTILEYDKNSYWKCQCDCGNLIKRNYTSLTSNLVSLHNCGCDRKIKWNGEISSSLFSTIRKAAKKRKIDFNLNFEDLNILYSKQNNKCALSNIDIKLGVDTHDCTASLDRIDNDLGYSISNCWWLHRDINYIKGQLSLQRLLELSKLISNPIFIVNKIPSFNKDHGGTWNGYGGISGAYWFRIKIKAKHEFKISIEEIWNKFVEQSGNCALTGIPLYLDNKESDIKKRTASLDRIDSTKGYLIDNIQWVHKDVNMMKLDYEQEYFKEMCRLINDKC